MADEIREEVEAVMGSEGWVAVDFERLGNVRLAMLRDLLLQQFESVVLRALNSNDVVVGRVEVARCKKCQALLQRRAGLLVRHAEWHRRVER